MKSNVFKADLSKIDVFLWILVVDSKAGTLFSMTLFWKLGLSAFGKNRTAEFL